MTVEATRPRASMFPIVPAHLARAPPPPPPLPPTSEAEVDDASARAEEFLPAGAVSAPLTERDFRVMGRRRSSSPVRLLVDSSGALCARVGAGEGWVSRVPLASDPPSAALRLEVRGGRLTLRCARDVARGSSPRLWFSEALLTPLQLPFLAPANIRGEKQYVCVQCGRQFEQPNPLKMHMALKCGCLPQHTLWERLEALAERLADPRDTIPTPANTFNFRLHRPPIAAPATAPAPAPASTPASSPPSSPAPAPAATGRSSAFQPWTKNHAKEEDSPGLTSSASHLRLGSSDASGLLRSLLCPSTYSLLPGSTLAPLRLPPAPLQLNVPVNTAPATVPTTATSAPGVQPALGTLDLKMTAYPSHPSEMETLVSNLGSSKHGHLCIYCGKVYSRKYGLKIHIRTHTGYKPLKCKYCLRPFGDPSNLNKHIRLHAEGETPYKCEYCGKVLVRRRDLDRHIRSRHAPNVDEDDASNLSDELQGTGSESA